MNRKKYITFTLMLSLLCMNKTYAACTQEEIDEFKKVEDEYKITYEFNKVSKDYTIKLYNLEPEKYGLSIELQGSNESLLKTSTINEIIHENVKPGEYNVEIKGITKDCKDTMKKVYLNLPKYNIYSEDELCKGIEEFVLCQQTYEKEIDYDTFVSRVNTYKKTKEKQSIEDKPKPKEKLQIVEYIKENLVEIIIVLTFVILLTITIIITLKSARKSRRLE